MNIKSIVVCSSGYPTPTDSVCPFVEQVVNAFSKEEIDVTVIAPQSITKIILRGAEKHPTKRVYTFDGGKPITVYQPLVFSFGNRFGKLNEYFRDTCIYRHLKKRKIDADVYYGHFWHHAYSLYKYAKEHNKPLFVVSGEAVVSLNKTKSPEVLKPFCDYISGLICVSTKNKEESIEKKLLYDLEKCVVIPNAIDNSMFYKMDKQALRAGHGISNEDFIVAFVGWYDNNKGVMRVSDAIKKLGNDKIKSFFIGDSRDGGDCKPNCDGILHTGRLSHDNIPEYLNMADVFVLPTLHEGCNNAIIEAMACGLPIISSNLSFNEDVLDEGNSLKVDPLDVNQIASSIQLLFENQKMRNELSEGALRTAESLTIEKRAEKILKYIYSKII